MNITQILYFAVTLCCEFLTTDYIRNTIGRKTTRKAILKMFTSYNTIVVDNINVESSHESIFVIVNAFTYEIIHIVRKPDESPWFSKELMNYENNEELSHLNFEIYIENIKSNIIKRVRNPQAIVYYTMRWEQTNYPQNHLSVPDSNFILKQVFQWNANSITYKPMFFDFISYVFDPSRINDPNFLFFTLKNPINTIYIGFEENILKNMKTDLEKDIKCHEDIQIRDLAASKYPGSEFETLDIENRNNLFILSLFTYLKTLKDAPDKLHYLYSDVIQTMCMFILNKSGFDERAFNSFLEQADSPHLIYISRILRKIVKEQKEDLQDLKQYFYFVDSGRKNILRIFYPFFKKFSENVLNVDSRNFVCAILNILMIDETKFENLIMAENTTDEDIVTPYRIKRCNAIIEFWDLWIKMFIFHLKTDINSSVYREFPTEMVNDFELVKKEFENFVTVNPENTISISVYEDLFQCFRSLNDNLV
ncbi:hypothetical protein NGRA_1135 [Nosema granulosis]|uniref:Uncharacterized protein n=1 Tax=Nosema granulosis TaxID=83296 RepID=A0A9P6KZH0_9MICR|nr:hypothetical protein NGRA_1135 [Nosema granulosis]